MFSFFFSFHWYATFYYAGALTVFFFFMFEEMLFPYLPLAAVYVCAFDVDALDDMLV